jgi:hypothetical protein
MSDSDSNHKPRESRRREDNCAGSEDSRHRRKRPKKGKRKRCDDDASSSCSSDDSYQRRRAEKKRRNKEKKKSKRRQKESSKRKSDKDASKSETKNTATATSTSTSTLDDKATIHDNIEQKEKIQQGREDATPRQEKAKSMIPMSREQYEAQRATIREVYDEQSGRYRLVRGTGEIIERIVSRSQHTSINQQATQGDGRSFARGVFDAARRR